MSRKLKRVPLDFDWPLKKVWVGYDNPYYSGRSRECKPCEGTGLAAPAKLLHDKWYGNAPFSPEETGSRPFLPTDKNIVELATRQITRSPDFYGSGDEAIKREAERLATLFNRGWMHHLDAEDVAALLKKDRLWDFTRTPRNEEEKKRIGVFPNGWLKKHNGYVPPPEDVNNWSILFLGHDSINCFVVIEAKCARLGLAYKCPTCNGDGTFWYSEREKKAAKRWKPFEPPVGEGFQLWEDVSEGSPISPVFASLAALCIWAEVNGTTFGSSRATAAEWNKMLEEDLVYHAEGNSVFI